LTKRTAQRKYNGNPGNDRGAIKGGPRCRERLPDEGNDSRIFMRERSSRRAQRAILLRRFRARNAYILDKCEFAGHLPRFLRPRGRDKSNYISPLGMNGQWTRIMNMLRRHERRLVARVASVSPQNECAPHLCGFGQFDRKPHTPLRLCNFVIMRFTRRHALSFASRVSCFFSLSCFLFIFATSRERELVDPPSRRASQRA